MNLQIKVGGKNLGFDEVVDTLDDVLSLQSAIKDALTDGAQVTDLLVLFNQYGKMKEVVVDFPAFARQFSDLTPDESDAVVAELVRRRGTDTDTVNVMIISGLNHLSRTYRFVHYVIGEGKNILADWSTFFKLMAPNAA